MLRFIMALPAVVNLNYFFISSAIQKKNHERVQGGKYFCRPR